MDGWIKLHRSLLEWEWFTDSNTLHVFVYLLLTANIKDTKFKGFLVPKGSLITTVRKISDNTRVSSMSVRTALQKLKISEQITIKTTNKFTVVSICNYDKYQEVETSQQQTTNKRNTNKQQTTNKQLTSIEEEGKNIRKDIIQDNISIGGEQNLPILPTKEEEKGKKKRDLVEDARKFKHEVAEFVGIYPAPMLEDFWGYWSEPNKSGTKMKFELQPTWDLARRLSTWAKNEAKFSQNRGGVGARSQGGKTDSKSTLEALVGNS